VNTQKIGEQSIKPAEGHFSAPDIFTTACSSPNILDGYIWNAWIL